MVKRYNVIYADPPWQYGSKQYQDGDRDFKSLHEYYDTMTIDQIKDLNVNGINIKEISCDDCACFMWVTDSHLKEGIEVLESWGFKYKTIAFVWLKKYSNGSICYNFAPWTMKSTEICLLGIKGSMSKFKTSNNVRQFLDAERTKHSKKPDEVRKRIENLFSGCEKIELFARQKTEGWDVWGNEIDKEIKPSVEYDLFNMKTN